MLNSKDALATIAVTSVSAARRFYGDVLGLTVEDSPEEGVFNLKSGPDTTLKGDIHEAGKVRVAWLRDPDGNVLQEYALSPSSGRCGTTFVPRAADSSSFWNE